MSLLAESPLSSTVDGPPRTFDRKSGAIAMKPSAATWSATPRTHAEEQQAAYQNRRRVRGDYGKSLLRRRGELVERSFAHCYETGGMRRTHLRGHQNILKRQ